MVQFWSEPTHFHSTYICKYATFFRFHVKLEEPQSSCSRNVCNTIYSFRDNYIGTIFKDLSYTRCIPSFADNCEAVHSCAAKEAGHRKSRAQLEGNLHQSSTHCPVHKRCNSSTCCIEKSLTSILIVSKQNNHLQNTHCYLTHEIQK